MHSLTSFEKKQCLKVYAILKIHLQTPNLDNGNTNHNVFF